MNLGNVHLGGISLIGLVHCHATSLTTAVRKEIRDISFQLRYLWLSVTTNIVFSWKFAAAAAAELRPLWQPAPPCGTFAQLKVTQCLVSCRGLKMVTGCCGYFQIILAVTSHNGVFHRKMKQLFWARPWFPWDILNLTWTPSFCSPSRSYLDLLCGILRGLFFCLSLAPFTGCMLFKFRAADSQPMTARLCTPQGSQVSTPALAPHQSCSHFKLCFMFF